MKRLESVSAGWPWRDKRSSWNAGATGVALWLCLATSAVATPSCNVSTPGLSFGSYDVFAAGVTNGNATLTISCDLNPPPGNADINYTISLSTGSANSFVQRQMKSGANTFGYNLYTTNSRATVWGTSNFSDGYSALATVGGTVVPRNYTVYGRIPAGQYVAPGSYGSTITVTVTY